MATFNQSVIQAQNEASRQSIHKIKYMASPKEVRAFVIKWFNEQYHTKHPYLMVNANHCLQLKKNKNLRDMIKSGILVRGKMNFNNTSNTVLTLNPDYLIRESGSGQNEGFLVDNFV